jgi:hypothetical protein
LCVQGGRELYYVFLMLRCVCLFGTLLTSNSTRKTHEKAIQNVKDLEPGFLGLAITTLKKCVGT